MKKKIILSLVMLFVICFSAFGFAGCDNAKNPAVLEVKFGNLPEGNVITVPRMEIGSGTTPEMVQEMKDAIFTVFGFSVNYYKMGKVDASTEPTETFTSYQHFLTNGGMITGFNLAQKERNESYTMQIKYLDEEVEIEYKIRPINNCDDSVMNSLADLYDKMRWYGNSRRD